MPNRKLIEGFIELLKMQRDAPNEATRIACINRSIATWEGESAKLLRDARSYELKTDATVFQLSCDGLRPFEIRLNDRGFKNGDILILKETLHSGDDMRKGCPLIYTGRRLLVEVTSIVSGYGLSPDWVVMGVKPAGGTNGK